MHSIYLYNPHTQVSKHSHTTIKNYVPVCYKSSYMYSPSLFIWKNAHTGDESLSLSVVMPELINDAIGFIIFFTFERLHKIKMIKYITFFNLLLKRMLPIRWKITVLILEIFWEKLTNSLYFLTSINCIYVVKT